MYLGFLPEHIPPGCEGSWPSGFCAPGNPEGCGVQMSPEGKQAADYALGVTKWVPRSMWRNATMPNKSTGIYQCQDLDGSWGPCGALCTFDDQSQCGTPPPELAASVAIAMKQAALNENTARSYLQWPNNIFRAEVPDEWAASAWLYAIDQQARQRKAHGQCIACPWTKDLYPLPGSVTATVATSTPSPSVSMACAQCGLKYFQDQYDWKAVPCGSDVAPSSVPAASTPAALSLQVSPSSAPSSAPSVDNLPLADTLPIFTTAAAGGGSVSVGGFALSKEALYIGGAVLLALIFFGGGHA